MLGVLIPMYNEAADAVRCIDAVMKVIAAHKQIKLIVVNDGSQDKTLAILNQSRKRWRSQLMVVTYAQNKGYGGALQTGIEVAMREGCEFALFMDSDLTNDPRDILRFAALITTQVDCIKASRYIKRGKMVGVALYRQWISRLGNSLASICFGMGIHDCTNGFRCTRLSMLEGVHFKEKKFAIILEELYYLKQKRARCCEIPVTLTARQGKASSFMYQLQVFWDYGKYALRALFL